MARPTKQGLLYYNIDCDIFLNRKVRSLIRDYGGEGWLVYTYVLTEIYRDKGYYVMLDNTFVFDISFELRIPENKILEIIDFCCGNLFDRTLKAKYNILTSEGIQERWLAISKRANRSFKEIDKNYDLLTRKPEFTSEETNNDHEETIQTEEETIQSKESKKNKEIKHKGIYKSIEIFIAYRTREFSKLDEPFRIKLAGYGINGPDIRATERLARPYIDAVEVLVDIWNDSKWQNQMKINYKVDDEKLSMYMKGFIKKYITGQTNYDETGFKQHFTNSLNKKING